VSGKRVTEIERAKILVLRRKGYTLREAEAATGRSRHTIFRIWNDLPPGVDTKGELRTRVRAHDPVPCERLSDDARRAHDDFSFFSERYLAREPVPWRQTTADQLVAALAEPEKSHLIVLAPPGVGKTSLALDLTLWSVVRNRAIRVLLGAEILARSESYLRFVKARLQATIPFVDHQANPKREATGILAQDFGRFRPLEAEGDEVLWRKDAIIVAQLDGGDLSTKEPTITIGSRDSGFLGARFDLMIFDDLATLRNFGDEGLLSWWTKEAETRLEPGGVLALIGSRIGDGDLFGECMTRTYTDDTGEARHIYEDLTFSARNEATGELLDPKRLSAADLAKREGDETFGATYLQDVSAGGGSGLVEREWLAQCWDDRAFWDTMKDENDKPLPAYLTVDPAQGGESYWALEVWQVYPLNRHRFLQYGERGHYDVTQVLDATPGRFTGVLEDIMLKASSAGLKVVAAVIEKNAAVHFLESSIFQAWRSKWGGLPLIPFRTTPSNRGDGVIGVRPLLQSSYREANVRLPRFSAEEPYMLAKVQELTRARPRTTDTIMSEWIGAASLDKIISLAAQAANPAATGRPFIPYVLPPYLERQRPREPKPLPKGHPQGNILGEVDRWWEA
jgi:hypothetical protein